VTEHEYFELLDLQMQLTEEYKNIFLSIVDEKESNTLVMCSQFRYLKHKFQALWYDEPIFDEILTQHRPQYGLFTPTDFEKLVQSIMFIVFGRYYETTQGSHDEGIDLIINEKFAAHGSLTAYSTRIVQCKLYRTPVPISEVRDFFGVMVSRAATGYFVTSSTLSNQAIEKFLPLANSSAFSNKFYVVTKETLSKIIVLCDDIASEIIDLFLNGTPADEDLISENRKQAKELVRENPKRQESLF
jgi:hypothetical protein